MQLQPSVGTRMRCSCYVMCPLGMSLIYTRYLFVALRIVLLIKTCSVVRIELSRWRVAVFGAWRFPPNRATLRLVILGYEDSKGTALQTCWLVFASCFLHRSLKLESYPTDGQTHGCEPAWKHISCGVWKMHSRDAFQWGYKLLVAVYQRTKCHEPSFKSYYSVCIDFLFCC